MKASKLIKLLQLAMATEGDITIQIHDRYGERIKPNGLQPVFVIRGTRRFTEWDFSEEPD